MGQKQKTEREERKRDRKLVITMASYVLQHHLGWHTQSRLGQILENKRQCWRKGYNAREQDKNLFLYSLNIWESKVRLTPIFGPARVKTFNTISILFTSGSPEIGKFLKEFQFFSLVFSKLCLVFNIKVIYLLSSSYLPGRWMGDSKLPISLN